MYSSLEPEFVYELSFRHTLFMEPQKLQTKNTVSVIKISIAVKTINGKSHFDPVLFATASSILLRGKNQLSDY